MRSYSFFTEEKPRIFGHRGAMGETPENTLLSIQRALEDGAKFVELDVRGTKDGEVVIVHDATLGRTTNGRGRVSRTSLKDVKTLDAGFWFTADGGLSYPYRGLNIDIPTLDDLFLNLPEVKLIIEIKQARPSIVQKVIETVRQARKEEQVLLATEKDKVMSEIRKELQESRLPIATGFSYGEVAAFIGWVRGGKRQTFLPPGQALQIPCEYGGMTLVSDETVNAARDLGVEVFVWTVNDIQEMKRLLRLGVDGIITDYPSRLRDLIAQKPFQ
ncbi:MAG: glycerophosphodiester phosphodiesterase [Candidatus Binatia bacterium]